MPDAHDLPSDAGHPSQEKPAANVPSGSDSMNQDEIDAVPPNAGGGPEETAETTGGSSLGKSDVLSQNDLDAILAQAGGEAAPATEPARETPAATAGKPQLMELPDLERSQTPSSESLDLLKDISLNVKIELGRTQMYIEDILKLNPGSVVELDKLAGDPVDILVNNRLVAKGEVLILNDNFCVRIGEVITPEDRLSQKTI